MSVFSPHPAIRLIHGAVLILAMLVIDCVPVAAEHCPETQAEYIGQDRDERQRVCEAASAAEAALAACGVKAVRRYVVRIVPEVRNPYGNCIFGRFRSNLDVAEIITPAAMDDLVATIPIGEPMGAYKLLPSADLHRSLIIHEISHAIVQQNLKVSPCHAVYEYVAAVVQLSSLPEQARQTYLQRFAGEDTYAAEMFNDIVLAMNPARFAAAAYRHFLRPENGCAFVRRLMSDPATVPRVP